MPRGPSATRVWILTLLVTPLHSTNSHLPRSLQGVPWLSQQGALSAARQLALGHCLPRAGPWTPTSTVPCPHHSIVGSHLTRASVNTPSSSHLRNSCFFILSVTQQIVPSRKLRPHQKWTISSFLNVSCSQWNWKHINNNFIQLHLKLIGIAYILYEYFTTLENY